MCCVDFVMLKFIECTRMAHANIPQIILTHSNSHVLLFLRNANLWFSLWCVPGYMACIQNYCDDSSIVQKRYVMWRAFDAFCANDKRILRAHNTHTHTSSERKGGGSRRKKCMEIPIIAHWLYMQTRDWESGRAVCCREGNYRYNLT